MAFVATAIGAVTSIGGAIIGADAKRKAANAMGDAINSMKPLDIEELKTLASDTDIERFKRQFEVQRENDPTFAALRDQGGAALLRGLIEDGAGTSSADTSYKAASEEAAKGRGETDLFIKDLLDRAKADLDAGATLPPEFQAELVKAGLESAGSQGLSIEGRGAAGSEIRRLLGSEGLALKERRETSARTNLGAAATLRENRMKALSELATLGSNLSTAKASRATSAAAVGSAAVPAIGLTGADAVKFSAANTDFENQRKLALGGVKGNKALNNGAMFSSILGSVGGALTSTGQPLKGSFIGGLLGA